MSSPPAPAPPPTTILRPWPQFLDTSTFSLPISFSESTDRISQNLRFFSPNYTLILLTIFLLSLLTHPLSLIFFLLLSLTWAYLFFLRTDPLEIFNFSINDRVLLVFLGLVSVVGLFWAKAWGSLAVAVGIGGLIVGVHAVIKAPEEDIEGSPYGALLSDLDGGRGDYLSV